MHKLEVGLYNNKERLCQRVLHQTKVGISPGDGSNAQFPAITRRVESRILVAYGDREAIIN